MKRKLKKKKKKKRKNSNGEKGGRDKVRGKLRGEIPLVFSLPRQAFFGVTSFIRMESGLSIGPTITGESGMEWG